MSPLINQLSPNPRLQRTPSAPLSRKPLGDKLLYGFVAALVLLGASVRPLAACSCAEAPLVPGPAVKAAAAVFLGEVVSIEESVGKHLGSSEFGSMQVIRRLVHFRATEAWKGVRKADVTVLAGFGDGCDFPFEVGQRYLVFAYSNSATPYLVTGQCTHTFWAWRDRELDPIRGWRQGKRIK